MDKMYAFWKYDIPPFLLGGEVKPVVIVPLEKGIKLQKKLDKANAKYKRTVTIAKEDLLAVVKEICK